MLGAVTLWSVLTKLVVLITITHCAVLKTSISWLGGDFRVRLLSGGALEVLAVSDCFSACGGSCSVYGPLWVNRLALPPYCLKWFCC